MTEVDLNSPDRSDFQGEVKAEATSPVTAQTCDIKPVKAERRTDSWWTRNRQFEVGHEVLSRWTDGLLYLGQVKKIDEEEDRCLVKFEDGSRYWILTKDLSKVPMPGSDIVCVICEGGASDPPNEIVICDNCNQGYHQHCHIPPVESDILKPEIPWCCRQCIFAKTSKKGGAEKEGPNAQAMQTVKTHLPYSLTSLTWDSHHKTNRQQCYCYCGGPGEWYMKMLQCCRCQQWFHEACLQCLNKPLLLGDRFYIFVCAICNYGVEFVHRLDLKWADVAHLALFNLTVQNTKKYFDFDPSLMPFINENWENLQLKPEMACVADKERNEKILGVLISEKTRFKSGKEIKKKATLWGLRARVPPSAPTVVLPISGPIDEEILKEIKGKSAKTRTFVPAKNSPVPLRKKKESQSEPPVLKPEPKVLKPNRKHEPAAKDPPKLPPEQNPSRSANEPVRSMRFTSSFKADLSDSEDTSSHGTLDAIIPHPTNFEGFNHPFWNLDRLQNRMLPRPLKRKLSEEDIQVSKNSDIRRRYRRHTRHIPAFHSPLQNGQLSEGSMDTGSDSENTSEKSEVETMRTTTTTQIPLTDLKSSVNNYFGAANRIASGEKFSVLARRLTPDGRVQYLIEWEGVPS